MSDEEAPALYEPFAVQELFLDGFFSDARIEGNSFRCTAFSMQSIPGDGKESTPVAVLRLIMTPHTLRHFMGLCTVLLNESAEQVRTARRQRRRV